jgi:hypothetical protein
MAAWTDASGSSRAWPSSARTYPLGSATASSPRRAFSRRSRIHALAQEIELGFAQGPLQAQEQSVVVGARLVDAFSICEQCAEEPAQLQQLMPIPSVPGQATGIARVWPSATSTMQQRPRPGTSRKSRRGKRWPKSGWRGSVMRTDRGENLLPSGVFSWPTFVGSTASVRRKVHSAGHSRSRSRPKARARRSSLAAAHRSSRRRRMPTGTLARRSRSREIWPRWYWCQRSKSRCRQWSRCGSEGRSHASRFNVNAAPDSGLAARHGCDLADFTRVVPALDQDNSSRSRSGS